MTKPRKWRLLKPRLQKRFFKGSIHRGLIIRTKSNFHRANGVRIKFNKNTVVLITKNVVPVSNRVFGPVLRELCMKYPSLGCVSSYII
jgi:ribosomal protein L14